MFAELLNAISVWSLISTLVLLVLAYTTLLNYSGKGPPGPLQLPFVGSYFALRKRGAIGRQFSKWRKKYGDPFCLRLGSVPIVVVNSWPVIQEAMKSGIFDDKYPTTSGKAFATAGNGISNHNGIVWSKMRKIGVSIVRKYTESDTLPINVDWAVRYSLPSFPKDYTYFNPTDILSVIESNLGFCNVIGRCEDTLTDPCYKELLKCAVETRVFFTDSMWIDYFPVFRFFLRNSITKFEKDVYRRSLSILNDSLQEHKSTYVEGQVRDFADGLISYQMNSENDNSELAKYLDDVSICQLLFEFFQASADTSTLSLVFAIRLLAQFPDVQKKIWDEINNEIGSERLPVQSDKGNCPYTLAVVYEALRISMPVTSGFMRRAAADTTLGGYEIKRGTGVILNYVGVSVDHANWPEPDIFRPDRFLEPDGSFVNAVPSTFVPFGTGRRSCFGEKVAILHLFLAVVILVREFEFMAEPGFPVVRGLTGKFTFETIPVMILGFPTPFKIAVRRR